MTFRLRNKNAVSQAGKLILANAILKGLLPGLALRMAVSVRGMMVSR